MKKLVNLMVLSVFFGTQIFAINLGFKLSLYRILFLVVGFIFSITVINNDERVRFYPNKVSSTYLLFYGWWVLYSVLSIIWVENIAGWVKANIFIGIGTVSILFIQMFIKEKKDLLTLFKSITIGIALHIVLGLSELATGRYLWATEHFMTKYRPGSQNFLTRIPISIYPNQNDYATVLLMGSFFLMILFRTSKYFYEKLLYLSLWILAVFLIYQTDSRANVLALLLGFGAMLLAYLAPLITKKGIVIGSAIGASVALLLVGISSNLRTQVWSILMLFSTDREFGGSSNEMRVNLIRNGFIFLKDTLGFGVGAGNIEHWMQNDAPYQTGGISNMHNWWMEILTAYGIITFALYLMVYLGMVLKAYKYYRNSSDFFIRQTALALIGYLIAFTMSSISSASNIINEWQWLIFGVIIAFYSYCERVEIKNQIYSPKPFSQLKNSGGNHG